MRRCFIELFTLGYAYSVETYYHEELIGGLYGIKINNFYSAESMFYTKSNGSKIALCALFEKLKNKNIKWIDIQMITPITKSFGAVEISRSEFIKRVKSSTK
jgi:leucyl/phenylalanyl-tRNA--protein transferase